MVMMMTGLFLLLLLLFCSLSNLLLLWKNRVSFCCVYKFIINRISPLQEAEGEKIFVNPTLGEICPDAAALKAQESGKK